MPRGIRVDDNEVHRIVRGIKARRTSKSVGHEVGLHVTTVNRHFMKYTGESVRWYHLKANTRAHMTAHQQMIRNRQVISRMKHRYTSSSFQGGRMVYAFGRSVIRALGAGMGRRR